MDTIFAHRGASFEAPENTLPAFQLALEQGCKALELDVQLSKDGHIMVCHDDDITRTTDGSGLIQNQTLQELKLRDAGCWKAEKYKGTMIPTLNEVFELCSKDILINVEIKNVPYFYKEIEEKVVGEIQRFGFQENTIVSSFDHHALKRVQELDSKLRLGVLHADHLIQPWTYIKYSGIKAYSIHPLYTFIDETYIKKSHKEGYKVFAYTVDERKMYQHLGRLGTDGIFTNIPSRFQ